MKRFSSFIHKEFLHIFRDSRTMLILLVMPIVLICLFGFAISNEVRDTRVVVVDEMQSPQSHRLVQRIDANAYFSVVHLSTVPQNEEAWVREGIADIILTLSDDCGIQVLADGSEPNQAQSRVGYLTNLIMGQLAEAGTLPGVEPVVNTRMLFNPQLRSEYNFVPGLIGLIIMLICAMMTSISIVREKEMGTMEILLASPLHPLVIILSKLIPYFFISSINIVTILLLSRYCFGLPIGQVGVGWTVIPSFLLVAMVFILVSLALGLFISCLVSSQLAAMLLSLLLIVPAVYLSGLAFPLESMPVPFQNASRLVPARWFIDAARRLLIQGVEFRYIARDFAILCLQAVVLIGISLKLFKTRLE